MLGEGRAWRFSSDKKSVVFATTQRTENRLAIVPTGPGVRRQLPPGEIDSVGLAFLSQDGRLVVFA